MRRQPMPRSCSGASRPRGCVFGSAMSIQAPPNLSPAPLARLVQAGINDWGGVSPLTPDFVNPESPWPELEHLREQTEAAGKTLDPAPHGVSRLCEDRPRSGSMRACAARCWSCPTAMRSDAKMPGARAAAPICRRASRRATGGRRGPASARSCGTSSISAPSILSAGAGRRAVRRARQRPARGMRGGGWAESAGQRRCGHLRREPQHQLHQHLRLPLQLLRVLQGYAQARGSRARVSVRHPRDRATARSRRARAGPPRCACRAASIRASRARRISRSCAR